MPLSTGLQRYYPLNGDAIDVHGGVNGVITGPSPTWGAGRVSGQSLDLRASASNRCRANPFSGSDFSASIWLKPTGVNTYAGLLGNMQTGGVTADWMLFGVNSGDTCTWYGPGNVSHLSAGGLTNGNWHNLVATRVGTTAKLFVNSVLISTLTVTVGGTNSDFLIGSRNDNYANAQAFFNDVGLWDRGLSGAEIVQLYNSGLGKTYAEIMGDGAPIAAIVNGRVRVTFPYEVLDTPILRNPSRYSLTPPSGAPALAVFDVRVINTYTIDLGISGKVHSGTYSLGILADTVRRLDDGTGNALLALSFAGVQTAYSSPLSSLTSSLSLMGKGLSFPLRVGTNGELVKAADEDNVDECLVQLLRTEQGERPFAIRDGKLFGTRLKTILFENGVEAQALAFQTVNEAILVWEPRVRLLEMEVSEQPSGAGGTTIFVAIKYLVIASSNIRNLVFPFHLNQSQE